MEQEISFNRISIFVPDNVFLPRVETEFWAEKALQEIDKGENLLILDMFAGSGCLGVFLLENLPQAIVHFVDSEEAALFAVKKNLRINKADRSRFKIIKSNLFQKVKDKYNLIIANPPYVAKKRRGEVSFNVLQTDPEIALFGGEDGLDIIKIFLEQAPQHLKRNGKLLMEIDSRQANAVAKIARKNGLTCQFGKDQFGKTRWLKAELVPFD